MAGVILSVEQSRRIVHTYQKRKIKTRNTSSNTSAFSKLKHEEMKQVVELLLEGYLCPRSIADRLSLRPTYVLLFITQLINQIKVALSKSVIGRCETIEPLRGIQLPIKQAHLLMNM